MQFASNISCYKILVFGETTYSVSQKGFKSDYHILDYQIKLYDMRAITDVRFLLIKFSKVW